jgi:hypothetical protein
VQSGRNYTCIAQVAKALRDRGLGTSHMISIGGWDAPHPNTTWSGAAWADAWHKWNREEVAHPALGFDGFDGIDWDLEGYDDKSSVYNHFTPACMALVGEMSQALKRAGFIVSMVPPQSYLDVTTGQFDMSLLHAYPSFHPDFGYHGWNVYALWLSKYGSADVRLCRRAVL